jgi:hypothetical protein
MAWPDLLPLLAATGAAALSLYFGLVAAALLIATFGLLALAVA